MTALKYKLINKIHWNLVLSTKKKDQIMKTKPRLFWIFLSYFFGVKSKLKSNTKRKDKYEKASEIWYLIVYHSWIKEEVNIVIYYYVKSWKLFTHLMTNHNHNHLKINEKMWIVRCIVHLLSDKTRVCRSKIGLTVDVFCMHRTHMAHNQQ